jgi:ubiquinone/menaquinone biosynthesis C-methylase UbiE
MNLKPIKKHQHSGLSSRGLLDAKRIMLGIGLKKGDVVLDGGCGNGFFAIEAGAIIKNSGVVYAVDSSIDAIEFLRRDLSQKIITYVRPIHADITKGIPLDSAIMDAALLVNVLHGLEANKESQPALMEISRLVKPGGLLGVVDFKKTKSPGPDASVRLAPQDAAGIISPYGFDLKKQFEAGPWHYCLVFNRI